MKTRYFIMLIFGLSMATRLLGFSGSPRLVSFVEVCLVRPAPENVTTKPNTEPSSRRPMWLCQFSLYCRNAGSKPLVIPTSGFVRTSEERQFSITQSVQWKTDVAPDGSNLIRPDGDYGFVTLRPGETVLIRWTSVQFALECFRKLDVEYGVPLSFSRRFGCWTGVIRAASAKVMVEGKEISPEPIDGAKDLSPDLSQSLVHQPVGCRTAQRHRLFQW